MSIHSFQSFRRTLQIRGTGHMSETRMNRKERRRGKWHKLSSDKSFDDLLDSGDNAKNFIVALLREFSGEAASHLDDRSLYEAIRTLIASGCMDIYIRWTPEGVHVRPEFHVLAPPPELTLIQ